MGNCLRRNSAMVWAGDDNGEWVDISQLHPVEPVSNKTYSPEKRSLLPGELASSFNSSSTSSVNGDQVKIKITKRELEELVHGDGNTCAGELLARLIINGRDGGDDDDDDDDDHDHYYYDDHDQRHWRPNLQSIPEVD